MAKKSQFIKQSNVGNLPETPETVEYAGFWLRACAFLIDAPILFCTGFVFGFMLTTLTNPEFVKETADFLGIIISWLYFAFMEHKYGATFGKQALGLKVTDINGGFVTFPQATGRFFGRILSILTIYVGFIMAGFTKKKQALHDIVSDSLVIKK